VQPMTNSLHEIDYRKLGKAVAEELKGVIPEPIHLENTMDENGWHRFIKRGNDRTEYKNKRYSMK